MKWLTIDLQMFKREPKQQQQNFITDKINSYMHFTVKPGNRMRVSLVFHGRTALNKTIV